MEERLAEVLREHRRGLTPLEQAKSILRELPNYGLKLVLE